MTATPPKNKPFAFQAAAAGIAAPIAAVILGFALQTGIKDSHAAALVIGSVNVLLIIAGFILSIIALSSIPKYGRQGLLARGIAGLLLNGIFVAGIILFIMMINRPDPRIARLAGAWQASDPKAGLTWRLEFLPDQRFRYTTTFVASRGIVADYSGKYQLSKLSDPSPLTLVLSVESVAAGKPEVLGTQLVFGFDSVSDSLLQIRDAARTYVFTHQNSPPPNAL